MSLAVFDENAVRATLAMADCINLMADTQAALSRGDITVPLRTVLPVDDSNNALLIMPGSLPSAPSPETSAPSPETSAPSPETSASVFGAKLLSLFPGNSTTGEPVIQGQVLLFDGANGKPLALVDAASLTAIRTAAASGSATRLLANPGASSLALLGYGVQAHSHLAAMRAVRSISRVRIWGPNPVKANAFASQYSDQLEIEATPTAAEAIDGADLICAVSAAREPIIEGQRLTPGCHLNLVGGHSPNAREADGETMKRARLFTEITEFALVESGDILLAIAEGLIDESHIAGEIGAVLNGSVPGRQSPEEITLYKSLGNTAQDLAAAWHVYQAGGSPEGA